MNMLSLLIFFGSLFLVVHPFLLSNDDEPQRCYELELENCFREAFLSAIHPPIFHKRDVTIAYNETTVAPDDRPMDKKKRVRQIQICHDVRKFSSCFIRPGCSDQQAANIASVQYHMVFGKKLPMHVFLAYRGYGRELCDQQCYGNNMQKCKNKMSQDEQQEEQGYILELSSIIGHIAPDRDVTVACSRFNKLLINLMRLRKTHCGEMARCTCTDSTVQQGVDGCNSGCERLLHLDLDQLVNSTQNSPISFFLCNLFLLLSYVFIVI
ncbi:hypothetical protein CRE_30783 [Caenorhabditis remanei]|uniref:Uncharacterized protein n=1 Tax=Caenorhabditis remanei TaxID=31234 RepID=E3LU91_CAERE|nr:hypothetical protein CRE_30783 [Caenorhabditis remanei]